MKEVDVLLDVDEISRRTSQPKKNIYQFRYQGRGPRTFKVGRRLVAWASDVDAWIADQERLTARGGVTDAA